MKTLIKSALVVATCAAAMSSLAGEIADTQIYADRARNTAGSDGAYATQDIGVAEGSGRITNSRIYAQDARNDAFSRDGQASQFIGYTAGGSMDNVTIHAAGAFNRAAGSDAYATQQIGVIYNGGGSMRNTLIHAPGAVNNADKDDSAAVQRIGTIR